MTRRYVGIVIGIVAGVIVTLACGITILLWYQMGRELDYWMKNLPGASRLKKEDIVGSPSLFSMSSVRKWEFNINDENRRFLESMCNKQDQFGPDKSQCTVSNSSDEANHRLGDLRLTNRRAQIVAVGMTKLDFDQYNNAAK